MIRNSWARWLIVTAWIIGSPMAASAETGFDNEKPTVLITGSNRGIGLGFVEHYASEGWNVIATCRSPSRADELIALSERFDRIAVEQLDVTDHARVDELADEYRGTPIDLLVNNAAILGDLDKQIVGGLDHQLFEQVMNINVYGPMKLTEAFADHVAASKQKKVVALTSGLGSLTLMGRMSGFYYYRISKAGLNMAMRGLRADLKDRGIAVGLVAPGMVGTQLLADSGYRGKSLTPADSVDGMAQFIATLSLEDPGLIINTDGTQIPW